MQGVKVKNAEHPLLSEMYPDLRKGKWTTEEEEYASKLISYFNSGLIRVQPGLTLRAYLSERLHCDPMRITKKFTGNDCIGKQVFLMPLHDDKTLKKCETEMRKLRNVFINRLVNKNKERAKIANKRSLPSPKQSHSGDTHSGDTMINSSAASSSSCISSSTASVATSSASSLVSSSSSSSSSSFNSSHSTNDPPQLPMPREPMLSNTLGAFAADRKGGRGRGGYKRVSSAPDLASLVGQGQEFFAGADHLDDGSLSSVHPRKKRRKGAAAAIPRSRSMLSFDSFAEIDDRAAGELLLSFSETLRENFAALQKKTLSATKEGDMENDSSAKITTRLNALPAFFSSEATSSEAAKYHSNSNNDHINTDRSQSSRFSQSLSMRQPTGDTNASLLSNMMSTSSNGNNNNFSILEERVPFSSNGNAPMPPMFDGDGSYNNIFDLLFAVEMSTENAENNKHFYPPVDIPKAEAGGSHDIAFDDDNTFVEPEFFIGTGTDIDTSKTEKTKEDINAPDGRLSILSGDEEMPAESAISLDSMVNRKPAFVEQLLLLMWKRKLELLSSKTEFLKTFLPPLLFFLLMVLFKEALSLEKVEEYLVPIAFWVLVQKNVVAITYEKSARLQEAMSMMGLNMVVYWMSYFVTDGVINGFVISLLCTITTTGGLFSDGNFFDIFGLLFVFCISVMPFVFFICSFFSNPQTAGMGSLGICLGLYIVVIAADINNESAQIQGALCLFPPMALQLGCATFRGSFDGVSLGAVCGIMIATIPMYCFLAWYNSQIWPSDVGVQKSPFFLFQPSYWNPDATIVTPKNIVSPLLTAEDGGVNANIPMEKVNEEKVGRPTVQVQGLVKTFGDTTVVNGLTFDMYPNQITALLGHNGAGKTTTINMLTGLLPPDATSGDATIYGSSVLQNMDNIRRSMGVCPQHDVLFENLTVEEHILFFSQLKGFTLEQAQQEVEELTPKFHLEQRMHHFSHELSGGQRRKLSVAVAISGGSKFIVMDEPTAGMDPLARRELWDLLASLRHGRTMLLTTHYMDEADVLGDRVGIMSLGELQCMGSSQFLKTTFGAGYRLIVEPADAEFTSDGRAELTTFVKEGIEGAVYDLEDSNESQAVYLLPFEAVSNFGPFFTLLENKEKELGVRQFGVQITSLEDVFLNVGADHSVKPQDDGVVPGEESASVVIGGIGDDRKYDSNFLSQVIGLCKRKLSYCKNDIVTIPLILFPLAAIIAAAVLTAQEVISSNDDTNAIISVAIYVAAYLAVPGSLAEFIVKEKVDKLRNVLTVMGCTFEAYWLGSFIADYFLLSITTVIMFVTWFAASMDNFYEIYYGLSFVFVLLFNAYLIAFSYLCTIIFKTPKSCIIFLPLFILFLLILPNIVITMMILILDNGLDLVSFSSDTIIGALLYGTMLLSPHGAMVSGLLAIVAPDLDNGVSGYPNVATTMSCMLIQTVAYLAIVLKLDQGATAVIERTDVNEKSLNLTDLDEDVLAERAATMSSIAAESPLRIERLRKVFPPKREGQGPVVATQDVCFHVQKGEIFGLLGANGAGKTTTLSMLTRHYIPSAGDGFISNHSILSNFQEGSTNLGVVTQNNSLWELLSVRDHLKLFARLRGVPEEMVYTVVDRTLDQLELTPHRFKLAGRLSGGMKRKLCVAIALIGDPSVVLLDEPSAGLDPVSRRNLWNVILKTMAHRAVVLTTHSMEEAEALCKRIGIMVQGQLRALGTKQHLKTKFGSGYELAIKIRGELYTQDAFVKLDIYVKKLFPSRVLISDNGGLVTYTIAQQDMQMGRAFTALESDKEPLGVEDYSIAQPTLEQVFIRTVEKHTPVHEAKARASRLSASGPADGSSRLSVRRLSDNMNDVDKDRGPSMSPEEELAMEAFAAVKNSCGCSLVFTKRMAWIMTFLTILFIVIALVLVSNALFTIGIIMFIIGIPFCILCLCPCCKPPADEDD